MIYYKFKSQLKFTINKNCSYATVNFHTVYTKEYIKLHFTLRKNKGDHEKRTTQWDTVTSLLSKPLQQHHIITSFRPSKSLYSPSFLYL